MTVIFQSFALIFLLTLRAKKRILFQFCILSYHSTSFASADWTEYPFPFIHNYLTFSDITFYYVVTYIFQNNEFRLFNNTSIFPFTAHKTAKSKDCCTKPRQCSCPPNSPLAYEWNICQNENKYKPTDYFHNPIHHWISRIPCTI